MDSNVYACSLSSFLPYKLPKPSVLFVMTAEIKIGQWQSNDSKRSPVLPLYWAVCWHSCRPLQEVHWILEWLKPQKRMTCGQATGFQIQQVRSTRTLFCCCIRYTNTAARVYTSHMPPSLMIDDLGSFFCSFHPSNLIDHSAVDTSSILILYTSTAPNLDYTRRSYTWFLYMPLCIWETERERDSIVIY
jgi:hypothetical protein